MLNRVRGHIRYRLPNTSLVANHKLWDTWILDNLKIDVLSLGISFEHVRCFFDGSRKIEDLIFDKFTPLLRLR